MVAIIKTGHSIHSIFNYNENKVKQGVAKCIGQGNYPLDLAHLKLDMKVNRFLKQNALNENVRRNSVHISLNFDPSEKHSEAKLVEIAHSYMQKIGFGQQPYLIYEHHDAGHPHIHLVSIKVRADGSRVDTQNIGRNQSEKARKEIEKDFDLVVAQGRNNRQVSEARPIVSGRVEYGKMQSKKAIVGVLGAVLSSYKYSSLAELNAVLQLYNVKADRGSEDSRIFKARGLVYRILDQQGNPVGVPIKASDFCNKPTLRRLEEKFALNKLPFSTEKSRIKNAIDLALLGKKSSIKEVKAALSQVGIDIVLRQNAAGILYGLTYVDHKTKCVFNGSALGKNYSAKAMEQRCSYGNSEAPVNNQTETSKAVGKDLEGFVSDTAKKFVEHSFQNNDPVSGPSALEAVWNTVVQPEYLQDDVAKQLKGKRKKKKKRGPSDNH